MNKNKITIYLIVCLALGSISFVVGYFLFAKQTYNKNIHIIKENRNTGVYSLPYYYFLENAECTSSMGELYFYIQNRPVDIMLSQYLVDPFSSDLSQINLIPIFNKSASKWEGALILSAGIDGKMNYEFTLQDTIFMDNYRHLDLFYNSVDELSLNLNFNPLDFLYGKKDLLVSYCDCRESFIKTGKLEGLVELDSLINNLDIMLRTKKQIIQNRIYSVKLPSFQSTWEHEVLSCKLENGYQVSFRFYDSLEVINFKKAGEKELVGKLTEMNFENKKAEFIMCMNP